jgi:hypothetical protein
LRLKNLSWRKKMKEDEYSSVHESSQNKGTVEMLLQHIGTWREVSKGEEDSHKAVSGVACLQGIEGYGMAGQDETLGSPWPPLAICPCISSQHGNRFHRTQIYMI